jgi:DNA polymerase-1
VRMLLVDGGHLASRCRHAQASLRTSDGRRSGVIHGFLQSMSFVRNKLTLTLDQVWVVWDGGRAKWRMALYPDYKKRKPKELTDDDIREREEYLTQCSEVRDGLHKIGVRQIHVPGTEADDIISLIAHSLADPIISSGDRDFHQLCAIASFYDPKFDFLSGKDVLAKYPGAQDGRDILLLKALQGDDSDNIDGVRGIGEVRAQRVLPYVRKAFLEGDMMSAMAAGATDKFVAAVVGDADKVRRNMQLMTLPKTIDDAKLDDFQVHALGYELERTVTSDITSFAKFLKSWELEEHLDHLERW